MKYRRNWLFESLADVTFEDGTTFRVECQTGKYGKLHWIRINGENVKVNDQNMKYHEIVRIDFMTPASLIV